MLNVKYIYHQSGLWMISFILFFFFLSLTRSSFATQQRLQHGRCFCCPPLKAFCCGAQVFSPRMCLKGKSTHEQRWTLMSAHTSGEIFSPTFICCRRFWAPQQPQLSQGVASTVKSRVAGLNLCSVTKETWTTVELSGNGSTRWRLRFSYLTRVWKKVLFCNY